MKFYPRMACGQFSLCWTVVKTLTLGGLCSVTTWFKRVFVPLTLYSWVFIEYFEFCARLSLALLTFSRKTYWHCLRFLLKHDLKYFCVVQQCHRKCSYINTVSCSHINWCRLNWTCCVPMYWLSFSLNVSLLPTHSLFCLDVRSGNPLICYLSACAYIPCCLLNASTSSCCLLVPIVLCATCTLFCCS